MRWHRNMWTAVAAAALLATATSCYAAEAALKVGDKAPDWKDLPGVDGKDHSLSDYADAKALVVVFTCNHCPVAVAYEDRMIEFQKNYTDRGVQMVAICVNDRDADRLDKMKERAEEKGFNFPYLYDESQKSAKEYGATCTPHFFVLNGDREVVYMGAMDDNNKADKVEEQWLRDAVDAALEGKEPAKTATRQRGCSIKWKKG